MPRVQFIGPVPASPPGVLLFQPDEIREVGTAQADYLCRNAQFVRLPDAGQESAPALADGAPVPDAAPTDPTSAPASEEHPARVGDPAPFTTEG